MTDESQKIPKDVIFHSQRSANFTFREDFVVFAFKRTSTSFGRCERLYLFLYVIQLPLLICVTSFLMYALEAERCDFHLATQVTWGGKQWRHVSFSGWKREWIEIQWNTLLQRSINNLTLYVPCIIFQCVDKPTRCNTSYEWSLLFIIWLYMFRTITSPSSGTSSHKVYNALVCSCRRV